MTWLVHWLRRLDPLAWQHGVKLMLAGLITFYVAIWLRLQSPAWGVATCIVLVMAKYVGAIGEKALLRTFGNLAGAALGVLLVGNLAENGLALVAAFFVITAYCSWRYGGNAHPYAFLLCAVTLDRVVVPNLHHPIVGAWATATNRTLEISLGILVSTTVYSVLWPRYARVDFLKEIRAAFGELADALRRAEGRPTERAISDRSVARITKLRKLLAAGSRESAYFRHHFAVYSELVTRIASLYLFAGSVTERPAEDAVVDAETRNLIDQLNILAGARIEAVATDDAAATHRLRGEFRRALNALRARLEARAGAVAPAGAYLTLRHLHSQLRELAELYHFLEGDPTALRRYPAAALRPAPKLPTDAYWARNAIKSTTAGCAAWFLCDWLQPPGATYIPYFVWFFTLLSRQYQGNRGDRGVFQFAFLVTWTGLAYVLVMLFLGPFLVHFGVMILCLGALLFVYGYGTASFTGWSRWSRITFFFTLGWLSLDLQHGVAFEALMTSYWQVVLALWFAAAVDRLWWPILPHWEVCSRLALFFANAARLTASPGDAERRTWVRQLALLANEATAWAAQLDTAEFARDEPERWRRALAAMRLVAYRLRLLLFLGRRNRAVFAAVPSAEDFHAALGRYLGMWREIFAARGVGPRPSLAALESFHGELTRRRPVTLNPAHRIVFDGLVAAAGHLVEAIRRFEAEIAAIPLTDYRLDRSL